MAMKPQNKILWDSIPQQILPGYSVAVPLQEVETRLRSYKESWGLDLDPWFKGEHKWDKAAQVAFVEHIISGGFGSPNILFNCPKWMTPRCRGPIVIVDGSQRLEAVRLFMRGRLKIFGMYTIHDFEPMNTLKYNLFFHINSLATPTEVVNWYVKLNSGVIQHTQEELALVKGKADRPEERDDSSLVVTK